MTNEHGPAALARADRKVKELISRSQAITAGSVQLVNAPAGAGKTGLITRIIPKHVQAHRRVGVLTQTNEQADDLTTRLAVASPKLRIVRLVSSSHAPGSLGPNVTITQDARNLGDAQVVVATGHKWAYSAEKLGAGAFEIGLIDEAYQMAGSMLLYVTDLFEALELVGDPGQLSPFSTVETDRWTGLTVDPTRNAVATLRAYKDITPETLPVTRRLPAHAADIIREAFYPGLDFAAATELGARRLQAHRVKRPTAADRVIDQAVQSGWALAMLPQRPVQRNDREVAEAAAEIAKQLLERRTARVADEYAALSELTPERIAIGASHRDQVSALRVALNRAGVHGVVLDTANRLQGREFDVVIAWHPLSGQVEASSFHLDIGRMCVLTTRHRHACIVIARDGVDDLLESSVPVGEGLLGEPTDRTISGWEAHMLLLDELEASRVEW